MKRILVFVLFISICDDGLSQMKRLFLVEVRFFNGEQVKGILGTLKDSSIQVIGESKRFGRKTLADSSQLNVTIAFNEIQSIAYRKLNAPQTGALIGMGVGFLASFAVKEDTENCDPNSLSGPVCELDAGLDQVFAQLLIVTGATGVGAVIGSSFKKVEIQGKKNNLILFRQMILKKQKR